jgi:tetratricopeptide (TPR) repeat protein
MNPLVAHYRAALVEAILELAQISDHRNEFAAAAAEYREAIAVDAGVPEPHYRLGRLLRDKGDLAKALEELQLASALDPSNSIYSKAAKDLQQQMNEVKK